MKGMKQTDQLEMVPGQLHHILTALGADIAGEAAMQRGPMAGAYIATLDTPMTQAECKDMQSKINAALRTLTPPGNTSNELTAELALKNMDEGHEPPIVRTWAHAFTLRKGEKAQGPSVPPRGRELVFIIRERPIDRDAGYYGVFNANEYLLAMRELSDFDWSRLSNLHRDGQGEGKAGGTNQPPRPGAEDKQ